MESEFWIRAWDEGRTRFHQDVYNAKLVRHFPALKPHTGQRVLVPLCGKSRDLLWLESLGLRVHGVELYEQAVNAFFQENELGQPRVEQGGDFVRYEHGAVVISCGDFFKLSEQESYDFVYDRAALVALPSHMRARYAQVLTRALKRDGACLLIVYEYHSSAIEGPPFSVDADEIHRLYGDEFSIMLVESGAPVNEGPRLSALGDALQEKVYILRKSG